MYPKLLIDTKIVAQNVRTLTALCAEHGVSVVGITKDFLCEPPIARAFVDNGVHAIGDSRIENLMKVADLDVEKWLIRTPMASDAERTVRYADVSLNSEVSTVRALGNAAAAQGRIHRVVLMYDLGDLREGFVDPEQLLQAAEECMDIEGIELAGVGANLTCLSFVQPDTAKLEELVRVARLMQQRFGLDEQSLIVSAGNSATLHMMLTEGLPAGVTDLRLGESLLFGRERACYEYLPGTRNDAFVIEAEVVETKRKPSMPWGTIGPDSYGVVHQFENVGEQVRAIVAGGNQDFDVEVMWPVDERVKIIASSCDHTVLDITACAEDYPPGSVIQLRCGYHAALRAFTSCYVEKQYL